MTDEAGVPSGPIHPRVSVNMASSLGWTLDQDLAFYRSRGIDHVSVFLKQLDQPVAEAIGAIRAAGIEAVGLRSRGGALIEGADQASALLEPAIDTAVALRAPCLYFLAGPTPPGMPTDEAYDRLVEALGPAVDRARDKGVRLLIEPSSLATRSNGFIHSLADAAELSRDTGVGICLELQNCWYERHLRRLFRDNVDRIGIIQVSDFTLGEDYKLNRRVPGDGTMPLEWMLGLLLEAGYPGFFDLEFVGPAIEQEGYASAIDRGVEWLSNRLRSWGV